MGVFLNLFMKLLYASYKVGYGWTDAVIDWSGEFLGGPGTDDLPCQQSSNFYDIVPPAPATGIGFCRISLAFVPLPLVFLSSIVRLIRSSVPVSNHSFALPGAAHITADSLCFQDLSNHILPHH